MTSRFRSSVKLKIALLVWLGSVCILGIVLAYSYVKMHRMILEQAEKTARATTAAAANKVEQEFRSVEKTTLSLASAIEIIRPDEAAMLKLLRNAVENNQEIFGSTAAFAPEAFQPGLKFFAPYYYKTSNGLEYQQLGSQTYNYFQKDWYRLPEVLQKPVWIPPYFNEGGGYILMTTYSVPIFNMIRPLVSPDEEAKKCWAS